MKLLASSLLLLLMLLPLTHLAPMRYLEELLEHNPGMTIEDIILTNKLKAELNELAGEVLIGPNARIQVSTNLTIPWELLDRTGLSFSPAELVDGEFGEAFTLSQMLFEGDIVLTSNQAYHILRSARRMLRRRYREPRKIYSDLSARWPTTPIPYTYAESLRNNRYAIEKISEALNFWQDHTCMSFVFQDFVPRNTDHLEFFQGQGCYSLVGKIGGRQGVSIGSGCLKTGVVAHEIAHALGLWHEQSRPRSRNYIRLKPFNIIPAFMSNFLIRDQKELTPLGIPYDLGSVMHYGSQAFTVHVSRDTIETLEPGYQRVIGQRDRPAFYDVKAVNLAYCSDRCASASSHKCEYGGYPHPRNCKTCICPEGLSGNLCTTVEPSNDAGCGGKLQAREEWGTLTSPGYDKEGYETGKKCNWMIEAPGSSKVELEFFGTFQMMCTKTCLDFVEVKNQSDFGVTGMRFCCYQAPEMKFVSETSMMLVLFRSYASSDVGFQARYRISPEGDMVPQEPMFTPWAQWSLCSRTCGACGLQSRKRRCRKSQCSGETVQYQRCAFEPCERPLGNCGPRTPFMDMVCETSPHLCTKLSQSGSKCASECCSTYRTIGNQCRVTSDLAGGRWGEWGGWGECFRPAECSSCVLRKRYRVCDDVQCDGLDTDWEPCPPTHCGGCGFATL